MTGLPIALSQEVARQHLGPTSEAFVLAAEGAHEHFVIQVLTWLAELPDPLPSDFCKEF